MFKILIITTFATSSSSAVHTQVVSYDTLPQANAAYDGVIHHQASYRNNAPIGSTVQFIKMY